MRVETDSLSFRGGRDYNEDSVAYLNNGNYCAVAVADGLGGHGCGAEAAAIVSRCLTRGYEYDEKLNEIHILELFTKANAEVVHAQDLSVAARKMKSTGTALYLQDGSAVWGHVGDTRLYHFINNELVHQTLDHSVSQMAVYSGEITSAQIRFHPDRNRLLKAFGDDTNFKAEIISPFVLSQGFHSFLLCTDGFWEYVLETEMELELAKAQTCSDWLRAMTQRLARRLRRLNKFGNDNFSAAAVFLDIE